jgi:hypothetical protein
MKSFLGFDTDPQPRTIPRLAKITTTNRVRSELRRQAGLYLSSFALVQLTGLTMGQVNGAIYNMSRLGQVDRLLPNDGRGRGRHSGQAYKWREGGRPNDGAVPYADETRGGR